MALLLGCSLDAVKACARSSLTVPGAQRHPATLAQCWLAHRCSIFCVGSSKKKTSGHLLQACTYFDHSRCSHIQVQLKFLACEFNSSWARERTANPDSNFPVRTSLQQCLLVFLALRRCKARRLQESPITRSAAQLCVMA